MKICDCRWKSVLRCRHLLVPRAPHYDFSALRFVRLGAIATTRRAVSDRTIIIQENTNSYNIPYHLRMTDWIPSLGLNNTYIDCI
jgi:hypothetical protein